MRYNKIALFSLVSSFLFLSCSTEDGEDGISGINGLKSIVVQSVESAGVNCTNGGTKLDVGIDLNGNNVLDVSEIESSTYVCGGTDGDYDKKITLSISNVSSVTVSATITSFAGDGPSPHRLYDFNIADYLNIDSVVFVIRLATQDVSATASAELYNITDGVSLTNSEMSTQSISKERLKTTLTLSEFPSKEVDLGIRLKTSDAAHTAFLSDAELVLYRK